MAKIGGMKRLNQVAATGQNELVTSGEWLVEEDGASGELEKLKVLHAIAKNFELAGAGRIRNCTTSIRSLAPTLLLLFEFSKGTATQVVIRE